MILKNYCLVCYDSGFFLSPYLIEMLTEILKSKIIGCLAYTLKCFKKRK